MRSFFTGLFIMILLQGSLTANPVVKWLGGYLLGAVADGVFDAATGKPDVRELDKRLSEVQKGLDESLGQPIGTLRKQITPDTSKTQYEAYVRTAISSLEEKVAKNSSEIEDLKKRVTALEGTQKGFTGELQRELDPNYQPRSQQPEPRRHELRAHKVLNFGIRGPITVWADGPTEVWADDNPNRVTLKPGQRLNFTRSGTIHARPKSPAATTLYSTPLRR